MIKKNKIKKYGVPTLPYALPIIGHLYILGGNSHRNLTKLVEKNGGIFSLWLGDFKTLIVTDPSINKEIMVKQFTNFSDRPKLKSFESFTGGSVNLVHCKKFLYGKTPEIIESLNKIKSEIIEYFLKKFSNVSLNENI
ncbi:hypothetical protein ACTFIZ_008809 [Dictyostelium cf. discoideum]